MLRRNTRTKTQCNWQMQFIYAYTLLVDLVERKFFCTATKPLLSCVPFVSFDGVINSRQLQGTRWVESEVTRVKELFGFLEPHSSFSITGLMQPLVLLFRLEKDQSEKGKSVLKGLQISNQMSSDWRLECTLTQYLGLKVNFFSYYSNNEKK